MKYIKPFAYKHLLHAFNGTLQVWMNESWRNWWVVSDNYGGESRIIVRLGRVVICFIE